MWESILQNTQIVLFAMAFVIFLLVELIKQPIKLLTKKLPSKQRQLANSVILLLPVGLGILGEYLFTTFYAHEPFDVINGVVTGGESMAMYGIIERVFGLKTTNPYETGDGALVVETANEIVKTKKFNFAKIFSLFSKLFSKKEGTEKTKGVEGAPTDAEEKDGDSTNEPAVESTEDRLKKLLDNIK